MKNKKTIFLFLFFAAAVAALIALAFCSHHKRGGDSEAAGDFSSATKKQSTASTENETATPGSTASGKEAEYEFRNLGYIYYLPEDETGFQRQVGDYLKKEKLKANVITTLAKYEDDKYSKEGTAHFYLQLDDEGLTVLKADYDKETEKFSLSVYPDRIENIEDYGGLFQSGTEEEAEFSTEGLEDIFLGPVEISEPDEALSGVADLEDLKDNLLVFLNQNGEERRNLFVTSAEKTAAGYKAELCFQTERIDGKNISVIYENGKYIFSLE